MDLQGIMLQIALIRPDRDMTAVSSDGNANKDHVESNRYNRHDLVVRNSGLISNNRYSGQTHHVHYGFHSIIRGNETY